MSARAPRTCWVAVMFATLFLSPAESGDRRIAITAQEQGSARAIKIVDQDGREALNGMPSATSQIFDVTVGQGFQFVPNTPIFTM